MTTEEFEKLIDPTKYQVFLISCPAYFPINFAIHPWFVVNKKGILTRWEVGHSKEDSPNYFGYIRSDGLPFLKGLPVFSYSVPLNWGPRRIKLIGRIEGDEDSAAHKIITFIEKATVNYPYRDTYHLLGPNSNTYIQWVLNAFPEWKIHLPRNAFGKNYKTTESLR